MNPYLASVYDDSWSATTWTLVLTAIILGVVALLVGFIALVHHSIEHADDRRADAAPAPVREPRVREVSHA